MDRDNAIDLSSYFKSVSFSTPVEAYDRIQRVASEYPYEIDEVYRDGVGEPIGVVIGCFVVAKRGTVMKFENGSIGVLASDELDPFPESGMPYVVTYREITEREILEHRSVVTNFTDSCLRLQEGDTVRFNYKAFSDTRSLAKEFAKVYPQYANLGRWRGRCENGYFDILAISATVNPVDISGINKTRSRQIQDVTSFAEDTVRYVVTGLDLGKFIEDEMTNEQKAYAEGFIANLQSGSINVEGKADVSFEEIRQAFGFDKGEPTEFKGVRLLGTQEPVWAIIGFLKAKTGLSPKFWGASFILCNQDVIENNMPGFASGFLLKDKRFMWILPVFIENEEIRVEEPVYMELKHIETSTLDVVQIMSINQLLYARKDLDFSVTESTAQQVLKEFRADVVAYELRSGGVNGGNGSNATTTLR